MNILLYLLYILFIGYIGGVAPTLLNTPIQGHVFLIILSLQSMFKIQNFCKYETIPCEV